VLSRRLIIGLVCLILAGALFFLWLGRLPIVTMLDGSERRVLKVSVGKTHYFSNDPAWKAWLARVLPSDWRRRANLKLSEKTSAYESLMLWVGEYDSQHRPRTPSLKTAHVVFSDGRTASGKIIERVGHILCLEFSIFPRSQREFQLCFSDYDDTTADLSLRNPAVGKPTHWTSLPLPQTNYYPQTAVILHRVQAQRPAFPFRLQVSGRLGARSAWNSWRVDIIDRLGNWIRCHSLGPNLESERFAVLQPGTLKISAAPTEYITAGIVGLPNDRTIQSLTADARALELGLLNLYLLGAGEYLIGPDQISPRVEAQTDSLPLLMETRTEAAWALEVKTDKPSLLILYKPQADGLALQARLRERKGSARDGLTFAAYKFQAVTNAVHAWEVARLFPLNLRTAETNLEAEVIALHPFSEFYVDSTAFAGLVSRR
jgi:hypothetical protein